MYFVDYRDSTEGEEFNTVYDTFTIDDVYEMLFSLLEEDDEIEYEILYHLSNLFMPEEDGDPYYDIDDVLSDLDDESKAEYLNQLDYALQGFNFWDYGMYKGHSDGDIEDFDDSIYESLLTERIKRVVTRKRRNDHRIRFRRGKNKYVGDVTRRTSGVKPKRLWKMRAERRMNIIKQRISGQTHRRKRYYRNNRVNIKAQRKFIAKERKKGRWIGGVHHLGHPEGRY